MFENFFALVFYQISIESRHMNLKCIKTSLSYHVAILRKLFSLRKYFSAKCRSL